VGYERGSVSKGLLFEANENVQKQLVSSQLCSEGHLPQSHATSVRSLEFDSKSKLECKMRLAEASRPCKRLPPRKVEFSDTLFSIILESSLHLQSTIKLKHCVNCML
jgi:hypothetical protein